MMPDNANDQQKPSVSVTGDNQIIDICGLVVLSQPEQLDAVRSRLSTIAGLTIHAADACGRMAVTIENIEGDDGAHQRTSVPSHMDAVLTIPGVIDVSLAYSHCERPGEASTTSCYQNNA